MAIRVEPFFLPLRREAVAALVDGGRLPSAPAELAAVMAIILLRRTPSLSLQQIERALFDAQALALSAPDAVPEQVRAAWSALEPVAIDDIEELLSRRNLVFAPSQNLPFGEEPISHYGSDFQAAQKVPLRNIELDVRPMLDEESDEDEYEDESTPARPVVTMTGTREQTLAAHTVISMLDEHLEVDAYAGTGKTHLIMALARQAPGMFTYVTPFSSHMYGGRQAADGIELRTMTLYELALSVARPLAAARGLRSLRLREGDASPAERARIAGIDTIGPYSPAQVVELAERAINYWCGSDQPAIEPKHFTRLLDPRVDKWPFVAAAHALWQAMWTSHRNAFPFPLRQSHLLKWLTLQDAPAPRHLGTLLVDEAHDLMPAWRKFLDRYPGGCVFLGDPYQRLRGRIPRHGRNKVMPMTQSFRMGVNGENAIRRTLEAAPEQRVFDPFQGSRDHITRVHRWRGRSQELQDGLRVYANEWALLEDAQRLKAEGSRFLILPATIRELRNLVSDAVTLFNQRERAWQRLAGGFRTWEQFEASLVRDGRVKVVRLFEAGYSEVQFNAMLAAQAPDGQQKITLGLVPHVKNLQSSAVALNDCCFTDAQVRHGHEPAHAVYLAMSRVRDELWLPGDAFDRLAELRAEPADPWDMPALPA